MNEETKKIFDERTQNLHDVYDNKIPKRVPISVSLGLTVCADYGGIDRKQAYWNPSILEKAAEELCELVPSDSCMYSGSIYMPQSSQSLDASNKVMSNAGYMQHPNTVCMYEDEYGELAADPYAFVLEKCLPRIYKNLDPKENPIRSLFALSQDSYLNSRTMQQTMPMIGRLSEKFGYPKGEGRGGGGRVPMDWIADQLRSFSGISIDVRRRRQELIDALNALHPLMYKTGLAPDVNNINRYAVAMYQLHMATYLREKDFLEIWMPTWKRLLVDYASFGMRCGAFLEHDWDRLLDYVYDLPTGMYFSFEFTNPKLIKEKLGKKFVLGGGFPLANITGCTKQEAIDKTKEFLDIMAPGGQYIFGFDKSAVAMSDINLENLIAICETVRDYGVYDNPGTPTGDIFRKENYTHSKSEPFTSKYYIDWESYKEKYPNTPESAKDLIMASEDALFSTIFYLSC